jgi:hypothetical protein
VPSVVVNKTSRSDYSLENRIQLRTLKTPNRARDGHLRTSVNVD